MQLYTSTKNLFQAAYTTLFFAQTARTFTDDKPSVFPRDSSKEHVNSAWQNISSCLTPSRKRLFLRPPYPPPFRSSPYPLTGWCKQYPTLTESTLSPKKWVHIKRSSRDPCQEGSYQLLQSLLLLLATRLLLLLLVIYTLVVIRSAHWQAELTSELDPTRHKAAFTTRRCAKNSVLYAKSLAFPLLYAPRQTHYGKATNVQKFAKLKLMD